MCILYFVGENEKREMGEQSLRNTNPLWIECVSHLSFISIRYSILLLSQRYRYTMNQNENWKAQLEEFSLETIGIGNVFVQAAACELVGNIKTCPEDFIVREILGCVKDPNGLSNEPRVADISGAITIPDDHDGEEVSLEESKVDSMAQSTNNADDQKDIVSPPSNSLIHLEYTPERVVQAILDKCIKNQYEVILRANDSFYDQIKALYDEALCDCDLDSKVDCNQKSNNKFIIIPPFSDDLLVQPSYSENSVFQKKSHQNRSTFHRTLKIVFPLLKTSTCTEEESREWMKQHDMDLFEKENDRCIQIEKDESFHELIPYLEFPKRDLVHLYRFRNLGCRFVAPEQIRQTDSNDRKWNHKNQKRKRMDSSSNINDESVIEKNSCPEYEAWLFLKPAVDRDKRKEVHHIVSKNFKDFTTSTKSNVPLDGNSDSYGTTSVITVQWSKKAQVAMLRRTQTKKKGMNEGQKSITATLCVMKKRNLEHMIAINHLSSALRCRPSDIGVCGIKDMCAVTYQFCTLNNISPHKAKQANDILKHKAMQLGEFQKVDWKLNIGNHRGNEFIIKVRDIREVETTENLHGLKLERIISTTASRVHDAANRVYTDGFVNFFGEQRVGNAGPTEKVGVRSFDIGRAMLQTKFSEAIDLLLQGRDKDASDEYVEPEALRKIRQIWKESKGDPELTLDVFPRNRNVMCRERTVLQGLKRYGRNKPLDALRTLSTSIRMFWITSYQSYIWNKMATERLRRLGTKVVIGDLYLDPNSKEVMVVSNPDTVTLYDLVLPLPGFNVIYPTNIVGQLYFDILKQDGVEFRKDAISEATAKGAYRHLFVKPNRCETVCEKNTDEGLDATFRFQLPKGAFATMFLREVMASILAR